jgi:hypothetical protein
MNENISWGKIVVLVVAIASVGALGFAVGKRSDEGVVPAAQMQQPQVSPPIQKEAVKPIENIQADVAILSGWKVYTNTALGFSIKYPNGYEPGTELNDQYNRLTVFGEAREKYFEVRLEKDENPSADITYGFLGAEIVSNDIKLDGINGYKSVSTTGYGDAGHQGKPYVSFEARHNGDIYFITFIGDAIVSAEEQTILSTFKFTK